MTTLPQRKFKILLIGDDCIDVYRYGRVDRLSPEAPVPIFEPITESSRPGMASNVLSNLEQLGCEVTSMLGEASIKTRLIDQRTGHQILRIDQDTKSTALKLHTRISQTYDAVVISDYNKGAVDYRLIKDVRSEFTGPVFVDTKKTDLRRINGCMVKINEKEYFARKSNCDNLIVTLGERGAEHHDADGTRKFSAHKVEVSDVCGAGDTFLAGLTYQYLCTGDLASAIKFAMSAAAVTVQHLGVYSPTLEEIHEIARQR